MEPMPFFTVIIPLYNKESFVENAVKSILAQTFQDFEIIIVEDVSTDNSKAVVLPFLSDKIRLIQHKKNKGLSASRNTGIQNASAHFVTFLDADDTWKPNYLEKTHQLIQQFPEAKLFATNYEELYQNNMVIIPKNKAFPSKENVLVPDFFESSLGKPIYCSCSVAIEKSVFETVGYYDESLTFGEDIDFNIRANSQFKLAYSPTALVTYTLFSENQITNSNFTNKRVPDFNQYEGGSTKNPNLKKYLDFNRYILARNYKMERDWRNFTKIKKEIHPESLNFKQRLLLNAPVTLLGAVKKLKQFFIGKGTLLTTYD
jgi:glycosyltransferase involved in cell wall biosynthesis